MLTILLPTKGRDAHTLRFLWHAAKIGLPWRVVVADGQVNPTVQRLCMTAPFARLGLDYLACPPDTNLGCYFRKVRDALALVKTPYVMLADNDDFVVPAAIVRSIAFLERHPDYVAHGHGVAGFEIMPGPLVGRINRLRFPYGQYDRADDISSAYPAVRVLGHYRNASLFYAVTRTEAMQAIWRDCADINFSDLQTHEVFCAMRLLTMGKARIDHGAVSYVRQIGTSGTEHKGDWVTRLMRSDWSVDFKTVINRIASLLARSGADYAACMNRLRGVLADEWLRPFLIREYGPSQMVKAKMRFAARFPTTVQWAKRAQYRLAPPIVELDMRGIERTLSGPEFPARLAKYAPDLA